MGRRARNATRSRYGVAPVTVNGITYHSGKEARVHQDLTLAQRGGHITDLQRQVPFEFVINSNPLVIRSGRYPNGRKAKYVADFTYRDQAGKLHVIDAKGKGIDTLLSRWKRGLMEAVHGITVEIV